VVLLFAFAWIVFGALALMAMLFVLSFLREGDRRPAAVTLAAALALLLPLALLLSWDYPGRSWVVVALLFLFCTVCAMLSVKVRSEGLISMGAQARVDERDAVFHRFYRLEPGSEDFESYYSSHPEKRSFDDRVRAMPALAEPGSRTHHPLNSPFQAACFEVCEELVSDLESKRPPVSGETVQASAEEFTRRIKGFARYLGAAEVGCTTLNQAYVYSHVGRSQGSWGEAIELAHTHAVALAVPMSHEMLRHAPDSPATTETAFEYLEAAKIALVLARYIQRLGYQARAHVDTNYRVMCVPVAADAGLGELGRLGLLVTPRLGPRVRLAVVTTDLPLGQDPPAVFGVQDFCSFCRKCVDACPSGSVDAGEKREIGGVLKWQTVQDDCYRQWRVGGSDCALCVKVCPYSHPEGPAHSLVRWLTRRNHLSRRLALWADDLAYGRCPAASYPYPDWHDRS